MDGSSSDWPQAENGTLTTKPEAGLKPAPERRAAPLSPAALVQALHGIIDDAKAEDIVTLDLAGKTSIADAMIVASGRSDRHVGAIAERIMSSLKDIGQPSPRVEGMPVCDWVLIDAGDVIVHLFRPEVRGFYNLEKLWGMGRPLEGASAEEVEKPKRARKAMAESAGDAPKSRRAPARKPAIRATPRRNAAPR
ncbi:MAG: ribosome silencing factor [Methylobacterium sp.]|nr:ribosome silencing factor [Methylobacterium sp.]MCA3639295.1 ribosome silencing factor [Methylobacterium sp.]MCA3642165.1 ribosome silencing factor [Methylobacterium sp.]